MGVRMYVASKIPANEAARCPGVNPRHSQKTVVGLITNVEEHRAVTAQEEDATRTAHT